jgi:hypothetical protein
MAEALCRTVKRATAATEQSVVSMHLATRPQTKYFEIPKKTLPDSLLPITLDTLKGTTAGGLLTSRYENMRNFRARGGVFLILSAALLCLCPRFGYADGEPLVQVTSSDSKTVAMEELGTGIFSRSRFRISVSVRGGYDDNLTTSKIDSQASWFTNVGGGLTYQFGSPRTQLTLGTNVGFTYYFDQPGNDLSNNGYEPNLNLTLSLTHKATPRLTLSAAVNAIYQAEPDFSLSLGVNRRSGNYFYTQDRFSAAYVWAPRFSTTTSYTFGAIRYDDSSIGLFEDRIEKTIGNEFKFLIWPTTSLVGEYRFELVNYDNEGSVIAPAVFDIITGAKVAPAMHLQRDSTSHLFLAGVDHRFSPRLSVSFRGGVQFRDSDEFGSRSSPYFESTLSYALGKDTSVSWTNRYGIEESDTLLNPSRKTVRTGLQLSHNLTPRISGSLTTYYENDDYDGINRPPTVSAPFTEESFDAAIALRYAVTRYLGLDAGINHTEIWSDIPLRGYSRNRFWGGLSLSF